MSRKSFQTRDRRVPVKIKIDRSTVDIFYESEIMNLSKGGVFLRADIALPLGSKVDLEFTLPTHKKVVRALGLVVWSRKALSKNKNFLPEHPAGMGIQFSEIAVSDLNAILQEIDALA